MREKKCTAVVLAAGRGRRMGTAVSKQYLLLREKPVLYYALRCFQNSPLIDEIVLVTEEAKRDDCRKEFVEKEGMTKICIITAGGAERSDSVYAGLRCCGDCDYVFIHDGARPFVTEEILERLYDEVCRSDACVTAVPSKDTVKIVNQNGVVQETPDRSSVWNVQTPQVFSYPLIYGAYEKLQGCPDLRVTDDAMVLELVTKHPVRVVMGSYENIKLTTPDDLVTAEQYLTAYGVSW